MRHGNMNQTCLNSLDQIHVILDKRFLKKNDHGVLISFLDKINYNRRLILFSHSDPVLY